MKFDDQKLNTKNVFMDISSSIFASTVFSISVFPFESYRKFKQSTHIKRYFPYRGVLIFTGNIVPATTLQFLTNNVMLKYIDDTSGWPLKAAASSYCGIQGALISTIVDNCVVNQQVHGKSLAYTFKAMTDVSYFRIWKGFKYTAVRDSIVTTCMFWANPAANKFVQDEYGERYTFPACLAVGLIGSLLSTPFDMCATRSQQTNSAVTTKMLLKNILEEGGIRKVYTGCLNRTLLLTLFINFIPMLKSRFEDYVQPTTRFKT